MWKHIKHCSLTSNIVYRGIQIILNATSWGKESHSGAYQEMKVYHIKFKFFWNLFKYFETHYFLSDIYDYLYKKLLFSILGVLFKLDLLISAAENNGRNYRNQIIFPVIKTTITSTSI